MTTNFGMVTCPDCGRSYMKEFGHTCYRVSVFATDLAGVTGTGAAEAPAPSICQQTLQTALELTGGDRAKTHGDKRTNHQNIADLWNAYFNDPATAGMRRPFTAHDVAVMMCLLKIARLKSGTHNPDDYVDMCGYAAIASELADGTLHKTSDA